MIIIINYVSQKDIIQYHLYEKSETRHLWNYLWNGNGLTDTRTSGNQWGWGGGRGRVGVGDKEIEAYCVYLQ